MNTVIQIGQLWKAKNSPWTVRISDIRVGTDWTDMGKTVIVFTTEKEFVGENTGGTMYKDHFLQTFSLESD